MQQITKTSLLASCQQHDSYKIGIYPHNMNDFHQLMETVGYKV